MFQPRALIARLALLLLTLACVAASATRPAQAQPRPTRATPQLIEAARDRNSIDRQTALLYLAYALSNDPRLPASYRSAVPWDGTLPLLRLWEAAPQMPAGAARSAVERVLRGACDGGASLPNELNTTHFHIEYSTIGGGIDSNTYAASLETVWATEVDSFGWAAPPVSSNPPPGNRYHVRIEDLGSGLYGFVSSSGDHAGPVGNNPATPWNDQDAYASCMVLNNDFSGFPGSPQQALDATTAHEFLHSIQYGYGALFGANVPDDAFVEGGATWMEDEVFDNANDNYNYLWPSFTSSMGAYPGSPYPYWITFRGLTERFGVGTPGAGEQVMQDFFEETSKNSGDNLTALATALANKGLTLVDAYHDYAIAAKFVKTCGGSYVYPYCFEEATDYIAMVGVPSVQGTIAAVGASFSNNVQDDYALSWVQLPATGDAYDVILENTSSGGQIRGSVVCDTGAALVVSPLPSVVGAGASSTLNGFNSAGCSSVVAVLTNQAQTAPNPFTSTARNYTLRTQSATQPATPSVAWSAAAQMLNEAAGSVGITAQLSAVSAQQVNVPFSVGGSATAADHTLVAGSITIAPGALSGSASFNITDDTLDESDETIVVTLGTPTNATAASPGVQTITIMDDDNPQPALPTLQVSGASVAENSATGTVTVTLSAPAVTAVTVGYATGDGSASAGSDYVAVIGTLTFNPGVTSLTIAVTLLDDTLVEPDETINITLASPTNATLSGGSAALTIISDDQEYSTLLPLVIN
jgi:hypothetical protein